MCFLRLPSSTRESGHTRAISSLLLSTLPTFSTKVIRSSRVLLSGGRVARPFGFALPDPGVRLSRTRLFPKVSRVMPDAVSKGA